jgi:hypothetical protein
MGDHWELLPFDPACVLDCTECDAQTVQPDSGFPVPDFAGERAEMLAALRDLIAGNYNQPSGVTIPALDHARAIVARIDGKGGAS